MDIGIDLGTASVLVYVKGKGIVLKEPSVVAVDRNTNRLLKIGNEAQQMLGRTPGNIMAVRPLRYGVISQYDVTMRMLQYVMKKTGTRGLFRPRVVVCIPSGITEVEERAVYDATIQAGAKRAYLIEEPIAAALGAGMDIGKPKGSMVVDIGGGTTDIAVISMGGVVVSDSIRVAGDLFDDAIIKFVKKKHGLLIGERTAEELKKGIGAVWTREEDESMTVKGRSMSEGLPKTVKVTSQEMLEALEEPATQIVEAICGVLERTPPELIGDITGDGIVLTGGGALIYGLANLITNVTGIKSYLAKDPILCVAKGTGVALDNLSAIPEGVINLSRTKQMGFDDSYY